MNREFDLVKKWAEDFNLPNPEGFYLPDKKRAEKSINLVKEELNEVIKAYEEGDEVAYFDGLIDLPWVVFRLMQESGISHEMMKEGFDEVYRSNDTKACSTLEEADNTIKRYRVSGVDCIYKEKNSKFYIHRCSDDKLMKSINYSLANLKPIVDKYKRKN
jgi:hypothetical protein